MKQSWFICTLFVAFQISAAFGQISTTESPKINSPESEYEKWVYPYKLKPISAKSSTSQAPLKLVLSIVTESSSTMYDNAFFLDNGRFSTGWVIFTDGVGEWFSHGSRSRKGSCCSQIEKDRLENGKDVLSLG